MGEEGLTAGSGTGSIGQDGLRYSSSESEGASLRYSAFVRVDRLCGIHRSFDGSFPTSCTSETIGVSKPTVNCDWEELL